MSRRELPPCSVRDCERLAGTLVDGALLCPEHGLQALEKRRGLGCSLPDNKHTGKVEQ